MEWRGPPFRAPSPHHEVVHRAGRWCNGLGGGATGWAMVLRGPAQPMCTNDRPATPGQLLRSKLHVRRATPTSLTPKASSPHVPRAMSPRSPGEACRLVVGACAVCRSPARQRVQIARLAAGTDPPGSRYRPGSLRRPALPRRGTAMAAAGAWWHPAYTPRSMPPRELRRRPGSSGGCAPGGRPVAWEPSTGPGRGPWLIRRSSGARFVG